MSRTRTFENNSYKGVVRLYRSYQGSPWAPDSPSTLLSSFSTFDQMVDEVTPHFSRQIAEGNIVMNPMSHDIRSIRSISPGDFRVFTYNRFASNGAYEQQFREVGDTGNVTKAYIDLYGLPGFAGPSSYTASSDKDFSKVRFQALSRVDKPPAALMEDLLELRKTLTLLRHPLHEIINTASSLKRALKQEKLTSRAGGMSDAMADAWLKGRFVYMNAYYSINNLLKANRAKPLPLRRTARATIDTPEVTSGQRLVWGPRTYLSSGYSRDRLSAGILYEVTNPIDSFREQAGLRFVDLPPGVWAVVPNSWVVDRFLDISGALRGLRVLSDPNVRMLAGWQSRYRVFDKTYELVDYNDGTYHSSGTGGVVQVLYSRKERVAWTPSITDALPQLDLGSWKHELNLAKKDISSIIDLSALAAKKISSLGKYSR